MIVIKNYISMIYNDFKEYIDKNTNFDTYNSLTPNWYYKVLR